MLGENHSLTNELPEHAERIHALKTTNHHFARLFTEYDELNHEVCRLEQEGTPISDEHIEAMKKQRLKLKDELYAMIVAAE